MNVPNLDEAETLLGDEFSYKVLDLRKVESEYGLYELVLEQQ